MINTERTKILFNLVMQGNDKVIKEILACKGDEKKEDVIIKKTLGDSNER